MKYFIFLSVCLILTPQILYGMDPTKPDVTNPVQVANKLVTQAIQAQAQSLLDAIIASQKTGVTKTIRQPYRDSTTALRLLDLLDNSTLHPHAPLSTRARMRAMLCPGETDRVRATATVMLLAQDSSQDQDAQEAILAEVRRSSETNTDVIRLLFSPDSLLPESSRALYFAMLEIATTRSRLKAGVSARNSS